MLQRLGYPLLLILLPFAMYVQTWHGALPDRQHVAGDPGDSYWPDLAAIELAFTHGEFPLWNPYERAGYPISADPQPGVLYPVNWLLAFVGYLSGGVSFGLLQFKLLMHMSLAGLGMYMYLRGRGQPRAAGAVGGVAYQVGGFFAYNLMYSMNWPLAWAPWLLWSIDRLALQPRAARAVEVAVMAGLIVNAGSPPAVYYAAMIAVPYFVYRIVVAREGQRWLDWLRKIGPSALGAGALAMLWSTPQLIATYKLTKSSLLAEPAFAHAASGTMTGDELFGFVLRAGSHYHFYMGVCAVFLCAFALPQQRARRDVAFFFAITLVGTLLCLGTNTQVFRLFYELVPGFSMFRLAFRYTSLVSFGVSVLAGLGAGAIIQGDAGSSFVRRSGYVVLGFVFVALWLRIGTTPLKDPALSKDLIMAALLLASTWAAVYALRTHPSSASYAACLVGVLAIDYAVHVPRAAIVWGGARERFTYFNPRELAQLRRDLGSYRVYNEFALQDRAGSRLRIRDFRGYMDPLVIQRYGQLMTDEIRSHPAQMLSLFGVKYLLFSPHAVMNMAHSFIPNPLALPGVTQKGPHLFELNDPAPNAYWVNSVTVLPSDAAVRGGIWQVNHHERALVAREDLSPEQLRWLERLRGKRPSQAARVLFRGFNQVGFEASAPADGLLVINEAYFEGWRAEVDGESTPIVRVNSLMQGVRLKAGKHRVVLRFRPYYFLVPAWLSLVSVLALLGLWLRIKLRRR